MVSDDKIAVYEHPNPHMKSFCFSEPICPPRVEAFRSPFSHSTREQMKGFGNIGASVVQDLLAIPGIIEIRTRPKEKLLKKDHTASWEDIVPRAYEILQRALRKQRIHLVKR